MLDPREREENDYRPRDLLPADLWLQLLEAQESITNDHTFLLRDAEEIRGVARSPRPGVRGAAR